MRRSILLALVLVLALAGSSFAATITWEGEFTAGAKHSSKFNAEDSNFFGEYEITQDLELTFDIKEDKGVWDAEFSLNNVLSGFGLESYTVNVNEDSYQAVVWGNRDIGDKGDALELLTVSGDNEVDWADGEPIETWARLTTDSLGFGLLTQLDGPNAYVNAETALDEFTLGATYKRKFDSATAADDSYHAFAVYGGTEFDGISVDGAFALSTEKEEDNSAFGVKVGADVAEQLNISGSFRNVDENYRDETDTVSGYDVTAEYTDEPLTASVKYDVKTTAENRDGDEGVTAITVKAGYAEEDGFSVEGSYTMSDGKTAPASKITLDLAGPLSDDFSFGAGLTMASHEDGFKADKYKYSDGLEPQYTEVTSYLGIVVDATYDVNEKLVFKPSVASRSWENALVGSANVDVSSLRIELDTEYALADDATLEAKIGQESRTYGDAEAQVNRYTSFGLTVNF